MSDNAKHSKFILFVGLFSPFFSFSFKIVHSGRGTARTVLLNYRGFKVGFREHSEVRAFFSPSMCNVWIALSAGWDGQALSPLGQGVTES